MNKTERRQRNKQIAQSLAKNEPVTEIARRYHLSRTQVYRAAQAAENFSADTTEPKLPLANLGDSIRLEAAQPDTTTPRTEFASINNRDLFNQNSLTGLRRFGGRIDDDYLTIMRSFNKRIQLFREMGDDPMIASILNAITMTLRRISWRVVISDDTPKNQEAKAFLESCMNDMSQSWIDTADQVIRGTVQYGFQLAEVDYKKRNGLIPKGDAPQSKYDDGRIGWRKWVFIAPESLAPGREWVFDDFGGIQGFIQQPPPTFKPIPVPIQKAILFRLSLEKNNPEGKSILRPMYSAYWYKKNLEEIQAMAFERNGMGFPTFYLGNDTSKDATSSTSDISVFKNIGDNIRVDEQASLVIPYPKMGSGASPDNGVLFEFVTASGVDFKAINDAIVRYEQRLTMIGLAQFIHLGMQKIGTQALARTIVDFFTLSLSAWADMIQDSINRYAVERLFMINSFPGVTEYPRIEHERLGSETIADMADYLLKLVQSGLLTPDNDLESYLRELGDLPEKPEVETTPETTSKNNTPPDNNNLPDGEARKNETTEPDANNPHEKMSETFADKRGGKGKNDAPLRAVNSYQKQLGKIYSDWSDELSDELADGDEDDHDEIIAAALAALLASLRQAGRRALPDAVDYGLDGSAHSPDIARLLAEAIDKNEEYLADSLLPDLKTKIKSGLSDKDIVAALAAGAGAAALGGLLDTIDARVESYAGQWWALYNGVTGKSLDEEDKPVYWELDRTVKDHCETCLEFGDTEYESYQAMLEETGGISPADGTDCGANCRCRIREA